MRIREISPIDLDRPLVYIDGQGNFERTPCAPRRLFKPDAHAATAGE
jgi:hypothetical protein